MVRMLSISLKNLNPVKNVSEQNLIRRTKVTAMENPEKPQV